MVVLLFLYLAWVFIERMRRSGAPSQLRGNAAKKPRFMPPGPARTDGPPLSVPQPEPPVPSAAPTTPALGNVLLNKVRNKRMIAKWSWWQMLYDVCGYVHNLYVNNNILMFVLSFQCVRTRVFTSIMIIRQLFFVFVWRKVQRCLSSADAPAVSNAPVGSKALVRVLSAVPHGECKENSFRSPGPDFPEPEQPAETDSKTCSSQPNTHASCTANGKMQHFHILCVLWLKYHLFLSLVQ